MGKEVIKQTMKKIERTLIQHSPGILTGIGIAGMMSATIMAVKATPKATILIEEKKAEQNTDKLPPVEIIKTCWKCYIPATVTTVLSTTCLIGASSVNARRNAALATAYTISENALRDYKNKVVEVVGEKKEQEVRDAIAKDKMEKHPVTDAQIVITERGSTLCYDPISDRYFDSDIETLRRIANDLNEQMLSDMSISLNELYWEIGLKGTEHGDIVGWNINKGQIRFRFSAQIADDGRPCIVIGFENDPFHGYDHW